MCSNKPPSGFQVDSSLLTTESWMVRVGVKVTMGTGAGAVLRQL